MYRIHRSFHVALAATLAVTALGACAQVAQTPSTEQAAAVAASPTQSGAAAPINVPTEGAWTGVLTSSSGENRRVDVTFQKEAVSLHFGEPANCRQAAIALMSDPTVMTYKLKPSINGGVFCDGLYPGTVVITPTSSTILKLTIDGRRGVTWSANLTSAQPAP